MIVASRRSPRRRSTPSARRRPSTSTSSCTTRSPARPTARDPRNVCPQGRELPRQHRHRRHRLLRRRGRVLHLRLGSASIPKHQRHAFYEVDSDLGLVEHRCSRSRPTVRPNRGYKVSPQGWLLPSRALRPLRRPARRDGHQPDRTRASTLERGHHEVGTAGQAGDQLQVQHAARTRPMMCSCSNTSSRTPAWQPTARQSTFMPKPLFGDNGSGHARPPVAVEGTASRCSTTRPATPACRTWHGTTLAASCTMRRRCWRSPTRR